MKNLIRKLVVTTLALCMVLTSAVTFVSAETAERMDKVENSWRYENGERITEKETGLLRSSYPWADITLEEAGALYRGIDVSSWQKVIDWDAVKASGKVDFAIIRIYASLDEKNNYKIKEDTYYQRNVSECERLGIPYGVYVYSFARDTTEAKIEAEKALELLNGHNPTYPVYIDMEDKEWILEPNGYNPNKISDIAVAFCETVREGGYQAGIYANLTWFNNYLTSSRLDVYEKWVAQYYKVCEYSKPYSVWQHSSSGSIPGISGSVDMNFDYKAKRILDISDSREAGNDRYETAVSIANELKSVKGVGQFDTIYVASGNDYPDALGGSYLAAQSNAPILIVNEARESDIIAYIQNNLTPGGKVVLLGGEAVVSEEFKSEVEKFAQVERLSGLNRYLTNIETLSKLGAGSSKNLIVCTGDNYADCLSASASPNPIMIVGSSLTDEQKAYLSTAGYNNIYILGGPTIVSRDVETELETYISGSITRIAGSNRYETARLVAMNTDLSGSDTKTTMCVACGSDFPDGLTGGPLAQATNAALLLADNSYTTKARLYVLDKGVDIQKCYVFGGQGVLSSNALTRILG